MTRRRRRRRARIRPLRVVRSIARWVLAALLVFSGLSHLFWAREGFQHAVPDWVVDAVPIDKDAVVVASGAVELADDRARGIRPQVACGERRSDGRERRPDRLTREADAHRVAEPSAMRRRTSKAETWVTRSTSSAAERQPLRVDSR